MKINGKEYRDPELNYLAIRDLSRLGVDLGQAQADPFAMVDGYAALAMGVSDIRTAQEELSSHFDNGGDFQELADQVNKAVEESGFFQSLSKAAKATDGQTPEK